MILAKHLTYQEIQHRKLSPFPSTCGVSLPTGCLKKPHRAQPELDRLDPGGAPEEELELG